MVHMLALCLKTLMKACFGSCCKRPSLVSSNYSHVTSFVANIKAVYLAFIDNRAIIAYFLEYQLTNLFISIKIRLEVDLWLFLSFA